MGNVVLKILRLVYNNMGIVISKQPPLLTYGFGESVDYVDQLEFKASRNDSSKECRKDFDQMSPTPFLKWEDIC